jgi:hypothetical protein
MITWIEIEQILLNEISQGQKDKYLMISVYVESKELLSQKLSIEWWVPEAGEETGKGKSGQRDTM